MTTDEILSLLTLERIALTLNLIGTILLAFSFGRNPGGAYQEVKSRRRYLASELRPSWFYSGLGMMGLGFALQLVG